MLNVIGILLAHQTYEGILRHQTGYEYIEHYNKAAQELDLIPFYMSLKHVGEKSALGLCFENNKYMLKRLPIPKVIHNRAMTLSKKSQRKLNDIAKRSHVFNGQNRHDKLLIHQLLRKNEKAADFLPKTMSYSLDNVKKAMMNYPSFYVKPTSNSVGRGIMRVTAMPEDNWQICWGRELPRLLNEQMTLAFITRKTIGESYLIQQSISLSMYESRQYDLRVTVQRGDMGQWQVSGIAGKVASKDSHVTNLAKGGTAMRCETLFLANGFDPVKKREEVETAALQIAESLSLQIPSFSDLGMDMGIDEEGNIWLIEVNGRDQRYQYKRLKLYKTFYRTYETPMRYAKYLLSQSMKEEAT